MIHPDTVVVNAAVVISPCVCSGARSNRAGAVVAGVVVDVVVPPTNVVVVDPDEAIVVVVVPPVLAGGGNVYACLFDEADEPTVR